METKGSARTPQTEKTPRMPWAVLGSQWGAAPGEAGAASTPDTLALVSVNPGRVNSYSESARSKLLREAVQKYTAMTNSLSRWHVLGEKDDTEVCEFSGWETRERLSFRSSLSGGFSGLRRWPAPKGLRETYRPDQPLLWKPSLCAC